MFARPTVSSLVLLASAVGLGADLAAQQGAVARIEASPARLVVQVGEAVALELTAYDASGTRVPAEVSLVGPRTGVDVVSWFDDGTVQGVTPGEYNLVALARAPGSNVEPLRLPIPVTVRWPAISRIEVAAEHPRLYEGTTVRHSARALHGDGSERPLPAIEWTSSDPAVATVDRFGYVTAVGRGTVTIRASVEGTSGAASYEVAAFPATRLELTGGADEVRTGDVQTFELRALDARGNEIGDLPVTWSHTWQGVPGVVAPQAPAQVLGNKFVADVPGIYTVMASAGPLTARRTFEVMQRDVVRRVEVLGQGRISEHYTSDFWPFEGLDGRDYALTGSRQAESHAFVWDITDPTNIVKTDSIQVDARSVNDVKVSPDGRYGVISREGASDRRNGVVILDLADPAHPTVASIYTEGLTGGVHNVFATETHLFALSGGDKYVILDMSDLQNPRYVSEYDHPDSSIHDVWVYDGIAYSAEWENGVVVVDVGNGRWGGTIENPVLVTNFRVPSDDTHAVFPYYQESTGTFYLFVGDEIISRAGKPWQGSGPDIRMPYDPETGRGGYPRATSGYIQIVDFDDPENPRMVARYEVPEYGTHNMWVEDDVLYQAYYEGGARMVDVSGELMGNLYTQGREIAVFKANDPAGWIANAPAAWSVIPFKGNIFFSDNTSGLWSIRLQPESVAF